MISVWDLNGAMPGETQERDDWFSGSVCFLWTWNLTGRTRTISL